MNKICTPLCLLALAGAALAEEDKSFDSEISVGIITTSGNTETESYQGKLDISHDMEKWKNQYILEGLYKRDQLTTEDGATIEQTTAAKTFASAKSDFKIDKEHGSLFAYLEYERNRFSGFEFQSTIALGYSDRLFTKDNSYLAYDIGPGVTIDKADDVDGVEQDEEENFIIRIAGKYVYEFSENAKFSQSLSSNYSLDDEKNTKTKSVTSLTAQLNSSFALRASYTFDYNTVVADEIENSDAQTSLTVVYSF